MANFVIVAGGWRGGWASTPLAKRLRALGHEAYTPTLTGLGDRSHLMRAAPNLDTHIEDVCNTIRFEELHDVVLCGHSYAGMVITGVADALADRIATLVYLDAFVPNDGDAWWDLAGDRFRQIAIDGSGADGLGVAPPPNFESRGVAHPLAAFRQRIRLTGRWKDVPRKIFVYAAGWEGTPFVSTYERLRTDPGWLVHRVDAGHNLVVTAPDETLAILSSVVDSDAR